MANRSSRNPLGSHPMQRTMAARAVKREQFAAWLIATLDAHGVPADFGHNPHIHRVAWFVERGYHAATVTGWLKGHAAPMLHSLPTLAEHLGVELAELCAATGRPPAAGPRLRYLTDREGALSTLVHRWRTENGWTHEQLGATVGLSAGILSRIESGSHGNISMTAALALADAFEVPVAHVARAARVHPNVPTDLDAHATRADMPIATYLRRGRKAQQLARPDAARVLGVTEHLLRQVELGRQVPSEATMARAAAAYHLSLVELLLAVGHTDSALAAFKLAQLRKLPGAARNSSAGSGAPTFGAALKSARCAAKVSSYTLAEHIEQDRTTLSRYETGVRVPLKLAQVLTLAEALQTDPAPMVTAWVAEAA